MEKAATYQTSEESRRRHKRRIIPIVDARFQWKYTLLIMALGVGLTALMGGFLYKAHKANTGVLLLQPENQSAELQSRLMQGDQIFLLYLIVLVIIMAVGLGMWGLIVTHRISGPLHIVARYLSELAGGQYPDMRPLRKRDELQEFFAVFEEAINAMRDRDIMMLRDVDSALSSTKKGLSGDAKMALELVDKSLQRYRDSLADTLGERGPSESD